eukprot:scaffold102118_cov98-Cyclotella_meneghiniana.AAC.1
MKIFSEESSSPHTTMRSGSPMKKRARLQRLTLTDAAWAFLVHFLCRRELVRQGGVTLVRDPRRQSWGALTN